jgi:hypothetical protein
MQQDSPHDQRVALKQIFWQQQQQARGPENPQDMKQADELHQMFMNANVSVVLNQSRRGADRQRHAEQNIGAALGQDHEADVRRSGRTDGPALASDIRGTLVRCGGCSGSLGHNLSLHGQFVDGKLYSTQADLAQHDRVLSDVGSGAALIANGASARPQSTSPVHMAIDTKSDAAPSDDRVPAPVPLGNALPANPALQQPAPLRQATLFGLNGMLGLRPPQPRSGV